MAKATRFSRKPYTYIPEGDRDFARRTELASVRLAELEAEAEALRTAIDEISSRTTKKPEEKAANAKLYAEKLAELTPKSEAVNALREYINVTIAEQKASVEANGPTLCTVRSLSRHEGAEIMTRYGAFLEEDADDDSETTKSKRRLVFLKDNGRYTHAVLAAGLENIDNMRYEDGELVDFKTALTDAGGEYDFIPDELQYELVGVITGRITAADEKNFLRRFA